MSQRRDGELDIGDVVRTSLRRSLLKSKTIFQILQYEHGLQQMPQ